MAANDKVSNANAADVDRNPDAITGAPGSHPVGTGIGSASGAATGAALGAIGGPVGAIIGGVAGAIVGAGVGHAAGEWNDPTEDEAYWRNNYTDRPYVKQGDSYDTFADSYRYGGEAARANPDRSFAEAESSVRSGYESSAYASSTPYSTARPAIEDAYTYAGEQRAERQRKMKGEKNGSGI